MIESKKGCSLISRAPDGPAPSLLRGFLFKSFKIKLFLFSLLTVTAYAADLTTDKIDVISTTPLEGIGLTPDKIPADIKVVKGKKTQVCKTVKVHKRADTETKVPTKKK